MAAFDTPHGIATDSAGNIFVTDIGADLIRKFDTDGTPVTSWGSSGTGNGQFDGPESIACDSSGNVYVSDVGNNRIQKFTNAGSYTDKWTGFTEVSGIAIDQDDNVFVGDKNGADSGHIEIYNTNGVFQSAESPTGLDDYMYLTADTDGWLWICDVKNDRVIRYGDTETIVDFGEAAFATASYNSVMFYLSNGNNEIMIYDSELVLIDTFGTGGHGDGEFDDPTDLVIDTNGNMWVVDQSNARIQKFGITVEINDPDSPPTPDGSPDGGNTPGQESDAGDDDTLSPDTPIPIPTPDDYDYPGNNQTNVALPLIYGDMTVNSDSGAWVCPLIDRINSVYCVSGWPVQSVAQGNTLTVYLNGVETGSGWTFDESDNYESKGYIATLTFDSPQGNNVVTVHCRGKATGGVVIRNPVSIIDDWMDYVTAILGRDSWEKDESNFAQAYTQAEENGYDAAGVIASQNTLGFWLRNILNSFWGTFKFSSTGAVQLFFRSLIDEDNILETFLEEDAVTLQVGKDIKNIVNRVIINYAKSISEIDRRFKTGGEPFYFRTADNASYEDTRSVYRFGPRTLNLNFDWNRVTLSVETIQNAVLLAFNDPEF
ncbi:MAG: hypothetical protein GY841_11225, partial [FCB group bacterium]|nr:hypothetical protein [FCB group bacterium]